MSDEVIRQLVEVALNAAKKRLNAQTGFIHANYHLAPGEEAFTIPILENVYYILALFRTKNSENIMQAKALLEKVLNFQCPKDLLEEGNFPIYLHEFPTCYDQFQAIHLLPPFFWILKHFHTILGAPLKSDLTKSCERLIQCVLKHYHKGALPYLFLLKFTAAYHAFQEFLPLPSLENHLDQYKDQSEEWVTTKALKEILISLQMVYPAIATSPWKAFWKHLQTTWHPHLKTYVGPAFKEFQKGLYPQGSLYDLYCGYFSGEFSEYSLKDDLFHLQASLIQPAADRFEIDIADVMSESSMYISKDVYALNTIFDPPEYHDKGHHFFRALWGGHQFIHSFVCQGGNIQKLTPIRELGRIRLDFVLGSLFDFEDRERQKEISFYLNLSPETQFLIEDQASNTFALGEQVTIKVGSFKFKLSFEILEGKGKFMGHIIRGNRPAQVLNKGTCRYDSYDWQIFLRTIHREEKCRLSVIFSLLD